MAVPWALCLAGSALAWAGGAEAAPFSAVLLVASTITGWRALALAAWILCALTLDSPQAASASSTLMLSGVLAGMARRGVPGPVERRVDLLLLVVSSATVLISLAIQRAGEEVGVGSPGAVAALSLLILLAVLSAVPRDQIFLE